MKQFTIFNQLTAMPKRLAMVLTMIFVVGVVQVFADYTIEFKSNTKNEDGSTAQTSIANLISSGGNNVSTISAAKAYNGKSGYGVKLGSSSDVGYVTMNLVSTAQIKASKLVVSAAYFDSGRTLKVTITYTDNTTTTETLTPASTITAYDVELTAAKTIKTIKIESVTKTKGRIYCASIKVVAAATPSCTTPTVSWTTAPSSGNVGGTMTAKANTNYPEGLTYSSSNPSAATIDESGVIEYLKVGSTTITASVTGDGTTYCDKTVSVEKEITVTCGSTVAVNTSNDGNGTISVNKTSIQTCSATDSERQITITLNPYPHYSSNTPTISGITDATITGSGNSYAVQLPQSSNGTLSISATFKEDDKYTVTWSADGKTIKTELVYVNEQVSEVPTISDIPEENRCGDKFVGWTTEEIATPQDDAPAYFTTVAGSPKITGNIPFYAVFADYKD